MNMPEPNPQQILMQIASATRYPVEAFHFVRRGLDYTVHQIHTNPENMDEAERHVDGRQLCEGLRRFALDQYGMLARTMLARWNIHRTEDFGRIVFAMVEGGMMQKTDQDTLTDFEDGFNFDTSFVCEIPVEALPLTESADDSVESA